MEDAIHCPNRGYFVSVVVLWGGFGALTTALLFTGARLERHNEFAVVAVASAFAATAWGLRRICLSVDLRSGGQLDVRYAWGRRVIPASAVEQVHYVDDDEGSDRIVITADGRKFRLAVDNNSRRLVRALFRLDPHVERDGADDWEAALQHVPTRRERKQERSSRAGEGRREKPGLPSSSRSAHVASAEPTYCSRARRNAGIACLVVWPLSCALGIYAVLRGDIIRSVIYTAVLAGGVWLWSRLRCMCWKADLFVRSVEFHCFGRTLRGDLDGITLVNKRVRQRRRMERITYEIALEGRTVSVPAKGLAFVNALLKAEPSIKTDGWTSTSES